MRLEVCVREFVPFACNPDDMARYEAPSVYVILRKEWKPQLRTVNTTRYDERPNYYF